MLAALADRPGNAARPFVSPGVPVLRVMSVAEALPFYLDYLGFTLDWDHRFEPGMPLYVPTLRVIDPYGNVLRFAQPASER